MYNTSFLYKNLERTTLNKLSVRIGKTIKLLPDVQSTYREIYTVEPATNKVSNDLIIFKVSGKFALLILIDLSAAFDTFDQGALRIVLSDIDLRGNVLSWFKSYLHHREF